jgi:hypothetical protein
LIDTMAAPATFDPSQHAKVLQQTGNNKRWCCNYCPHEFSGSTSRVLTHLTGIGKGVATCENVPDDVKEAAKAYTVA